MRIFGLEGGSVALSALSFTPYVAMVSPIPVVITALMRRWLPFAVAIGSMAVLAAVVLPRAWGAPQPTVRGGESVTIMSLNMDDGQASPSAVAKLVREQGVDVLCLVELKGSLDGLDAMGVRGLLPHELVSPRSRAGGSALLSRLSLRRISPAGAAYLLPPPTADALLTNGTRVRITVSHPSHPTSAAEVSGWERDLDSIPSAGSAGPLRLVAGDFNATLDHKELRRVIGRGYRDAARAVGAGLTATWRSGRPLVPGIAIDHILVDRRARVTNFHAFDVPGSDHRAIVATVIFPRIS